MSETPGKRDRDEDDESQSFFYRLFSTAKKPKRARVESSTKATPPPATALPRLHLSPPSARRTRSPAATQPTVTFAVQETVTTAPAATPAREIPVQQPQQQVTAARMPPASPWQGAPILFHPGTRPPLRTRIRPTYRPNSRTLVPNRRRRRTVPQEYNAALVQRLLNESRNVLQPDPAYTRTFTVPGRRQYGTNQSGSRLPPRKKVSFDESQVAAGTPHVSSRNGLRNATPYARRTAVNEEEGEESPATLRQQSFPTAARLSSPAETDTAPLPVDFASLPREKESAAPYVLDNADDFVDTSQRRGTLVAERLAPSTLGVTPVPCPPPTRGYFAEEDDSSARKSEQDTSKRAAVEVETVVEESPPADLERPPEKRTKPNEGWGDTFKHLYAGKWQCQECRSQNDEPGQECAACEKPRAGATGASAASPAVPAAASTDGFSFGNSAAAVNFNFGAGAPPAETPRPFSFGATSANSAEGAVSGFVFNSAAKSDDSTSPKEQSSKKLRFSWDGKKDNNVEDSKPTFSFGTTPAEEKKEETKPSTGFSFGSTTPTTGGFSFGSTAKVSESKEEDAAKAPAAAAAAPEAKSKEEDEGTETKTEEPKTPMFNFGGTKPAAKTEPKPASTRASDKAAPATVGKPPKDTSFNFGTTKPADTTSDASATTDSNAMGPPPNKPLFAFGGATTAPVPATTTDAAPPSFTFGSTTAASSTPGTLATPTPAVSFGAPAPATTNGNAPQSSLFGSSTPAPTSTQEGDRNKKRRADDEEKNTTTSVPPTFTFGAATPAPATSTSFARSTPGDMNTAQQFGSADTSAAPQFGSAPAPPTGQSFTFGQTPANTPAGPVNAPSFGGPNTSTPSATNTGFGQSQNGGSYPFGSNTATQPPAMSFGTSATATPAAPAAAPVAFNFGTSSSTQAPSFGTPAPPVASSQQGFSGFGTTPSHPPAANPAAPFSAPGGTSATPSFNFGGAPAPAAPATGGFGGGFGSQAPAPAPQNGFGGNFGTNAAPGVPPVGATPNMPASGSVFSIGSAGGGGGRSSTGRRRIVRARRPPGSGR